MFQGLRGVVHVDQCFIQSVAPNEAWAEGVLVDFDRAIIDLDTLAEVHLRTHSGRSNYAPGGRYRSAVYGVEDWQHTPAELAIARYAAETGEPAGTAVLPLVGFRPSEPRYRDYYRTDPSRPFCRRYIDPKLDYIRRHFAHVARE